jgi:large subunit ribosomal protein L4
LNQKTKQLARKSALSYKAKENNILVVEDFNMDSVKTQNYIEMLKNLNIKDNKNLMLLGSHNQNIYLSSRNVQRNQVLVANEVNTYAILNAQKLIVTESALKALTEVLSK